MGIKDQLEDLEVKITKGLQEAYKKMLVFKKQKNSPVIMTKNGKIVKVKANLISKS